MGTQNMGLGDLGTAEFKRKFRWTIGFDVTGIGNNIGQTVCKTGARPNITIEEQQIDFLNGRKWIPGKATLETLQFTFYDIADDTIVDLLNWLAAVYNFTAQGTNPDVGMSSKPSCYEGTGNLQMFTGCGNVIETWTLLGCWPQAINFGELDMTSAEECTVELTIRYRGLNYAGSSCIGGLVQGTCCDCVGSGN